jgi:hypothetical protein
MKLIKTPKALDGTDNFWKVCPRLLQYLPEACCDKGKPDINDKSGRIQNEPECQWWINSEEHHYCFWKYIKDKSSPEGVMPELVQSELADLFGWSNTKTHFILKQAIQDLTDALEAYNANELLDSINEDDDNSLISSEYSPDDESYE